MEFASFVTVREVGTRDGFQMEKTFIPTEKKIEVINLLSSAGYREIQTTAFVHPKLVPNMSDAEQVIAGIKKPDGVLFSALVPNERGYLRAVNCGMKKVELTLSATDSHNINNMNATTEESLIRMQSCIDLKKSTKITLGLAVAFYCHFEGVVPYARVESIVGRCSEMGIDEVSLGDTTGNANPKQVYHTFDQLKRSFPNIKFGFHPHNTYGNAMANSIAALEANIDVIDSSVAGIGGCPFSPGASGNISSEDLIYTLELMGINTGINLDVVRKVASAIKAITGHSESNYLRLDDAAITNAKKPEMADLREGNRIFNFK